MKKYYVIRLDYGQVFKFNKLMESVPYEVKIETLDGRWVIDAKSIKGLCAIDLSERLKIEPMVDDVEKLNEFRKLISPYIPKKK